MVQRTSACLGKGRERGPGDSEVGATDAQLREEPSGDRVPSRTPPPAASTRPPAPRFLLPLLPLPSLAFSTPSPAFPTPSLEQPTPPFLTSIPRTRRLERVQPASGKATLPLPSFSGE